MNDGIIQGPLCINYVLLLTTYLHHQQNSIKNDEDHDEVFKRSGDHHSPDLVFEAVHFFGHVTFQWFGLDSKFNARFLQSNL